MPPSHMPVEIALPSALDESATVAAALMEMAVAADELDLIVALIGYQHSAKSLIVFFMQRHCLRSHGIHNFSGGNLYRWCRLPVLPDLLSVCRSLILVWGKYTATGSW